MSQLKMSEKKYIPIKDSWYGAPTKVYIESLS